MTTKELSLVHLVRPPKSNAEKAPLFLLIHGYGADEKDLFGFARHIPENFCVISIQAPIKLSFGGYAWYELDFTKIDEIANIPQALESKNKIISFIEEAIQAYYIDSKQIWLCGFSQGCILSYALAMSYPEKIHRIIGMSGFPEKEIIGTIPKKEAITHQKYFISHGTSDPVIPIFLGREGKSLLANLEADFVYKEYLAGHTIDQENYFDIMDWITENIKN